MSEQHQRSRGASARACPSCSRRGGHADWCPRLGLSYDPNPRMSDDEVRAMGLVKDDRGVWHRPTRPADLTRSRRARAQARGARLCVSCGIDPDERDHQHWCLDGVLSVGAALRDARDLEHAIKWEPKVDVPKIGTAERAQLNKLFAALVREREQELEQSPPRKQLWSIKEWRSHVACKAVIA